MKYSPIKNALSTFLTAIAISSTPAIAADDEGCWSGQYKLGHALNTALMRKITQQIKLQTYALTVFI